jgi:Lysine methyltransferase
VNSRMFLLREFHSGPSAGHDPSHSDPPLVGDFMRLTDTTVLAMPEMTRSWVIPASTKLPEMAFDIREPPLIGDNLGLKTWGTSYVIAKKLESLGTKYLDHLFDRPCHSPKAHESLLLPGKKVLELGAGTGLVGIAAGAIWSADVFLTDVQDIADNLNFNIKNNAPTVEKFHGKISGGVLDWRESEKAMEIMPCKAFEVILHQEPRRIPLTTLRLFWLPILFMMTITQNSLPMSYRDSSKIMRNLGHS